MARDGEEAVLRSEETAALVSVVVPTHNRASLLPGLLAALDAQDYPHREVIVVDDASTDETAAVLTPWEGEEHTVLHLGSSGGSYAARNAGWRASKGAIIAFTDDDCLPAPGWLSALVRGFEGDAVGVQGVTVAEPGEITPFTHQIDQRQPGPPYRTCNVAYRRSILERLGGFDESFRWYADNIFGLRARQEGAIVFAPDAVVRHPPRPREWRNRAAWLARFDADARHREILQRLGAEPVTPPRSALPVLLWVLRPLAKQSLAHLRYLVRHPRDYLREIAPMLVEKRELLAALREFYEGRTAAGDRFVEKQGGSDHALPPLPAEPLVSVIVVTRDRLELLQGTLEALARQTWPRREIIVVNNGSDLELDPGAARLIPARGQSLGAARQVGVEAVRGDIVAFTDDDCLPDPRWMEEMVESFRREPTWYGVQGRTVPGPGPVGAHAIRVPGPDPLYQTCNMVYRAEALRLAGGVDGGYQGWFEDTDLAARVLRHGAIGFAPDARVVHQAVPRRPLDRTAWRRLIADERRLAEQQPAFYRRVRGPSVAAAVVFRWLLGSPLKTVVREVPRAGSDPGGFFRMMGSLIRERWELVQVLLER